MTSAVPPGTTGRPLRIGITCWPTYGGSGIVATEVALELGRRGHRVHVIATGVPIRLDRLGAGVHFHEVQARDYPLFEHGTFPLALASKIVEVSRWEHLDVVHAHYAIPHATAAVLARSILRREGEPAPAVVTTLHGTDITLVGSDPGFLPITRYSILESDAVTTPSMFLRDATYERLGIEPTQPIEVIPNFVDSSHFCPPSARDASALDHLLPRGVGAARPGTAPPQVILHNSNFRPLKRVDHVVRVFAAVRRAHPSTVLLLVGDGPERSRVEGLVRQLGLETAVGFLGRQRAVAEALALADVFLLPSETESFGLAALEAQSCGVPVVATRVGGLPELIVHGETGLLCPPGDVDAMVAATISLVADPALRQRMGAAARARAVRDFQPAPAIDRYEAVYRRALAVTSSTP